MTLTDILPTLRRSIPDPLTRALWPPETHATTTDLVIRETSMMERAVVHGTPYVHPGQRPVLVVTVLSVHETPDGLLVATDAGVVAEGALWREARLIGRASVQRKVVALILCDPVATPAAEARAGHVTAFPHDLVAGDVVVVPLVVATRAC